MRAVLCSAGSIGCLLATTPALAQSESQDDAGAMTDIVVTANHREETLQKVPAAITAITGETLVRDITDTRYRTHVFSQRDSRAAFALFGEPRTYDLTGTFTH